MVVLVVGCGSYTGLAGVDGVVAGVDAMKRRLVEEGAEVRTLDGKVTERRLERALRSIGKVARRGQRAAVVLIGHTVASGFAVENFAMRKAGKRLRNFSAARVAHLMGGVAFGGGVATAKVHVPVVVLPPLGAPPGAPGGFTPGGGVPNPDPLDGWDPTSGKKKKFFFDPRWNGLLDRWLGIRPHGQIDAGNEGFRWRVEGGKLVNSSWQQGTLALVELCSPDGTRLGLLEIEPDGVFQQERWRFASGAWPLSNFVLRRILDNQWWSPEDLEAATDWPVKHEIQWKGFQELAGPSVQLASAFRFSTHISPSALPSMVRPVVWASTQTVDGVREVVGWFGDSKWNVSLAFGSVDAIHQVQVTLTSPHPPV